MAQVNQGPLAPPPPPPFDPRPQSYYFYTARIVNACFNWSYKYIVFKRRLERLRLRYTTFKTILDSPAFQWDRDTNFVSATNDHWNDLAIGNEFVNAYRLQGEPIWKELTAIFARGRPDEGPHSYLAFSSDEGESSD
ncbi:hypothetical protein Salat_0649000 [Sesamum alatum]|uniref:Myb/SANT-like domain-containing protein n=1 Tax=Sesamum alatum TaxID=300844 RepID=A0AAE1YRF2_9LAMI|nr:hypothetical protein Salat_0649000 [Sesamum alatum]